MITVTLCAVSCAALAIDHAARELVADVRLAMKRADLSIDFVSAVTGVPRQRLSDQLNGKTPFTAFWRFTAREIRETEFWIELLELRARRVDRVLLASDLAALVAKVEELVNGKPMRKAPMSPTGPMTVRVILPLQQETERPAPSSWTPSRRAVVL